METIVYVPYYDRDEDGFTAPLETLIVVFVSQWMRPENGVDDPPSVSGAQRWRPPVFSLVLGHRLEASYGEVEFRIPFSSLGGFSVSFETLPQHRAMVLQCSFPCILTCEERLCVAGLGSVLRRLLKNTSFIKCKRLLGFREGCLVACAEFSVWTRFCEIDLIKSTKQYLMESHDDGTFILPVDVLRFETHLNEPLKMHNIGKKKHQLAKEMLQTIALAESPKCIRGKREAKMQAPELPDLPHTYAEEMSMTLSDLIIYVCIHHILCRLPTTTSHLESLLPSAMQWHSRLCNDPDITRASLSCGLPSPPFNSTSLNEHRCTIILPSITQNSLCIRDSKRCSTRRRIYTRQAELSAVLDILKESRIIPKYDNMPDIPLHEAWSWSDAPDVVLPSFGNLPESRFVRKCQQLENMAKLVSSIAQDDDVIVDFCSGGGHLGILLAYLLPKCHIIMIENKEESVNRALIRTRRLLNTTVYQCNLDYFFGKFNIGVALHACGVATDLVIHRCLKMGASFVVCPCCYGGVRDTHLFSYPRSKEFRDAGLTAEEYYFLGHAADQTHENGHKCEQGKYCMGLVDTDRGLVAQARGYTLKIFTMKPATCTPKNNIILGIKSERYEKLQSCWI